MIIEEEFTQEYEYRMGISDQIFQNHFLTVKRHFLHLKFQKKNLTLRYKRCTISLNLKLKTIVEL